MELIRSKEKQQKFEKINETKRSAQKSPLIQHQSSKKDFDTLKRLRTSPDKQVQYSQKISPNKIKIEQQEKSVRKENEMPSEFATSERKSRRQMDEEAWIPQTRKSQSETPRRERSRGERRQKTEICPKCHHKKGRIRSKSSDQNLKSQKVDCSSSLPSYDRDKEEMEILKKYIRKENAHVEHLECNCIQTNIDFNRQFQFDSKKKSRGNHRRNKFDF